MGVSNAGTNGEKQWEVGSFFDGRQGRKRILQVSGGKSNGEEKDKKVSCV